MKILLAACVLGLTGCVPAYDHAEAQRRQADAQKKLDAANAELNEALRNEAFQQGNMTGTGCILAIMKRGEGAIATDAYCILAHSVKRYDEIHEDLKKLHGK